MSQFLRIHNKTTPRIPTAKSQIQKSAYANTLATINPLKSSMSKTIREVYIVDYYIKKLVHGYGENY